MAAFKTWRDYQSFAHYVKRVARYILDDENRGFLEAVLDTAKARRELIKKGSVLWRAQLEFEWDEQSVFDDHGAVIDTVEVPAPANPGRMFPLLDRAHEGRVNPKGIPCLYLSTEKDTAMAEVRPWIGSHVSVGQVVVQKDLALVDCAADKKVGMGIRLRLILAHSQPTPADLGKYIWWEINQAFAEPVTRSDDLADYTPTQVLAEAFRSAGFDGIIYTSKCSKLGSGQTVALFDVAAAKLANCEVNQVEAINLEFRMVGNQYFIEGHYPEHQSEDSIDIGKPEESAGSPSEAN